MMPGISWYLRKVLCEIIYHDIILILYRHTARMASQIRTSQTTSGSRFYWEEEQYDGGKKEKRRAVSASNSPAATCFLLERAAVRAIWLPLFLIYLWQSQQMSQANPEAGVTLGVVSRFLEQCDSIVRAPRLAKPEALSIITPFTLSQTNHQSQA